MNLLPFQQTGVDWLTSHFRAILADEMGLGKTCQVLGLINRCPGIRRSLVVCPASLKLNWQREFQSWCPGKTSVVLSGKTRSPVPDADMIIVNYDILEARLPDLPKRFDLVACDEAHYLKNATTKRSKAVFGKLIEANRVLFLTGTPIPNRPAELWPTLYAVDRQYWGEQRRFEARYGNGHEDAFGVWEAKGATHLDELAQRLQTCMLRRLKVAVLPDLPPKFRRVVELDAPYKNPEKVLGSNWRDRLLRAVDKSSIEQSVDSTTRREDGEAKAPACADYVAELLQDGLEKVIVFYHHTAVGDILQAKLQGFGLVRLDGSTGMKKRDAVVQDFQSRPWQRVFLGQIDAAGVGLTLTAAHHVVVCELPWVPGTALQAEDRAARIGQKNNVQVDYLVAANSIDSVIAPALVWKMQTVEQALGDVKGGVDQNSKAAEIFS